MTKHVAVIGAGVVGLCTALYCTERGWRVTAVERNGEQRDACSYGNTGQIVPSHFVPLAAPGAVAQGIKWMRDPGSPFYIRPRLSADLLRWGLAFWRASSPGHVRRAAPLLRELHVASRACYHDLAAKGHDFGLADRGVLMLCRTHDALEEEAKTAEHARALGLEARVLDRDATAALDPDVRMDVMGSVYFPGDSTVVPGRLMDVLQHELTRRGARFAWRTEITGFERRAGRIDAAHTAGADAISADEFVIATGAWSAQLGALLGLDIPLQAGKGYSLTLAAPRKLPQRAAILTEARVAVSPMGNTLRVGGTLELSGMDQSIDPLRVQRIVDAFVQYYPDFSADDFDGVAAWRGLRPCSPDGLPYVGRTRSASNLLVGTGHAMMGVSLAPITGKVLAQTIAGEPTDVDFALLSPDRYH